MITNKTRDTVLCETHEVAESHWQKTRGLMFRDSLPHNHGMLFTFFRPSPAGIWMFGMRFPIDILFIDSGKKVLRVIENAKPLGLSWRTWKLYIPPSPASYVLELPAGGARKTSTGDILDF